MLNHLTDTEQIWLDWYGRLRVVGYTGTVDALHRHVTGRPHPRARRRKLSEAELEINPERFRRYMAGEDMQSKRGTAW